MQLLTFLGTGRYSKTCYTWQEREKETAYIAEALCEFFKPESVRVFVTPEAQEMHGEQLKGCLKELDVEFVPIPSGKSETEIWEIFELVVNAVEPGSEVIFDITLGLRSIPLLVLLVSAFLQKARNVQIKGVYYGAFEVNRDRPPIFDMTPAIKLLDWLTATDKFLATGSSLELGQLLSTIQQDFYTNRSRQSNKTIKPTRLKSLGTTIQNISRSLELVRPMGLMEEAAKLQNIPVEELQTELGEFAKPFELLLSQIQEDYGQFALANSRQGDPKTVLKQQFLLLQWYGKKGLGTQGILLAREWIISALCIAQNIDYLDRNKRGLIERQLSLLSDWQREKGSDESVVDYAPSSISKTVEKVEDLAKFWSQLTEVRNDLAHTEMRVQSLAASRLDAYVKDELIQGIAALFPEWIE